MSVAKKMPGLGTALGPLQHLRAVPAGSQAGPVQSRPELVAEQLPKSLDPAYEKAGVYVRRATKKAAWRKWEDGGNGDFSDLIEKLMADYLGR